METEMPVSRAFFYISFRVPSKGPPPIQVPLTELQQRDAPFLEPFSIHLSKSQVNEPPSRFPSGAPMERDARLQSLAVHNLQGLQ